MRSIDQKILDNYFAILKQLAPKMKIKLSDRLIESAKKSSKQKSKLEMAFGGWSNDESAEELIEVIKTSRSINRSIEKL